ncbi:MAG: FkbM family methyltransferase [Candidatus Omnitrophica bacterium]|nr:FkbM family methyltransferase [Candidatus Omnitrophota bacterium]
MKDLNPKIESVARHTFINNLDRGSVVVDLGASRGNFSKKIAEKCCYSMLVLVEGNPELNVELKDFFKDNDAVKVVNAVIGGEPRDGIKFYLSESPSSSSLFRSFSELNKVKSEINVKMFTLNDIFSMYSIKKIDLLKMDIEGAEWDVLERFSKEDFDKIEQISVEFHDFIEPGLKARTKNCIKKNKKLGYFFINIGVKYINGITYKDCLFYKKKHRKTVFIYRLKCLAESLMRIFLKIPKRILGVINFKRHKGECQE